MLLVFIIGIITVCLVIGFMVGVHAAATFCYLAKKDGVLKAKPEFKDWDPQISAWGFIKLVIKGLA